jgi:hypothetical protein
MSDEDASAARHMRTVRYITGIPRKPLPPDHVVVHNHVRPAHPIGRNGFRVWIASPTGGKGREHWRGRAYEVERCAGEAGRPQPVAAGAGGRRRP